MTSITITQAISQAVAPVFLLAGISGLLNVLTSRLARIIDRSRVLHQRLENADEARAAAINEELATLTKRGHAVHRAIGFSTASALLVCVVIALLFLNAVMGWHSETLIGSLFVLTMLCLIISLTGFLREIQLATRIMLNGP